MAAEDRMSKQLRSAEPSEPIAILGVGCRVPGGVNSPDDLSQLLSGERDAISKFLTESGWNRNALFGPDPDASATYVRTDPKLHSARSICSPMPTAPS